MFRLSAAILSWKDCLMGNFDSSIYTSMDNTAPLKVTASFRPQIEVRIVVHFYVCIIISLSFPLSLYLFVCLFVCLCTCFSLFHTQSISHELLITNQLMHLQPPLELSRCHLIYQLHKWISIVTGLQRIQSMQYQVQ